MILVTLVSFYIMLLLTWVVVLFKQSRLLRRKLKYSIEYISNQDTHLGALNAKVEYYKSLFFLAIVFIELVSYILCSTAAIDQSITDVNNIINPTLLQNATYLANDAIALKMFTKLENTSFNCNDTHTPEKWELHSQFLARSVSVAFTIVILLGLSPVYILMSYYAMIITNSLNNDFSMKSVDLSQNQKKLILLSFIMFTILLILMLRIELLTLFELFRIFVALVQTVLTYRYSRRRIRALRWKILDTKIAFGTDNYQFRLYTKSLKHMQFFITIFLICIINFCIYIILQSSADIAILIHPIELNLIFGLCIPLQKSSISLYEHILESFIHIALILVPFPLIISNLCIFFMNVSTIPYLLSKMNISCNFNLNFCQSSYNKISSQVGQPLLS